MVECDVLCYFIYHAASIYHSIAFRRSWFSCGCLQLLIDCFLLCQLPPHAGNFLQEDAVLCQQCWTFDSAMVPFAAGKAHG